MALTRFKDARADKDGPVSGAIIVIPLAFAAMLTNKSQYFSYAPPTGMQLDIVSINVQSGAITGDPKLTVGTAKAGAEIVAAVTVATNLGDATLVSSVVPSGSVLDVRIVTDTGDVVADGASVSITAYVSKPPTSLLIRGDQAHI
jgi:hypothetical protein